MILIFYLKNKIYIFKRGRICLYFFVMIGEKNEKKDNMYFVSFNYYSYDDYFIVFLYK